MANQSGGIPTWVWIVGAIVVAGVVVYAMQPKKKTASLSPPAIVLVQNAPSVVPA